MQDDHNKPPVTSKDVLSAAIDDANARYKAVEAALGPTLVDTISIQDWKAWSAMDEKATFADCVAKSPISTRQTPSGMHFATSEDDPTFFVATTSAERMKEAVTSLKS